MKSVFVLGIIFIFIPLFSVYSANHILEVILISNFRLQSVVADYVFNHCIFLMMSVILLGHMLLDVVFDLLWKGTFQKLTKLKKLVVRSLKSLLKGTLFVLGFGFSFEHIPLYILSFFLTALLFLYIRDFTEFYRVHLGKVILHLRRRGWL